MFNIKITLFSTSVPNYGSTANSPSFFWIFGVEDGDDYRKKAWECKSGVVSFWSYSHPELRMEIILNYILFIPLGFLLYLCFGEKRKHGCVWIATAGFLLSASIEISQLVFRIGLFDWGSNWEDGMEEAMVLDHIALIVSSEECLRFYEKLGFKEIQRFERSYDTVVFMECGDIVLEIFIDPNHPERVSNPEAKGLRHVAFCVDDLSKVDVECEEIRTDWFGRKFTFTKDPDGQPIELKEKKQ